MDSSFKPIRYDLIKEKNPREILMLRGKGCVWKKCTFCDYHLDCSPDEDANYRLNLSEISKIQGLYNCLEIINSGSFCELDSQTINAIENKCLEKGIRRLHFEMHWIHRSKIPALRKRFAQKGITVTVKMGVETFQADYREQVLKKGMGNAVPSEIQKYADEVCLLFGLEGQTLDTMVNDIEIGLKYFQRICINLMIANTTSVKPQKDVIQTFMNKLYPLYITNPRVDILLNNTDFGVGGIEK